VFTINNPGEDLQVPASWTGVDYAIWQLEKGENGTPHLQGYVCFTTNKRLSVLKKLHATAHWEIRAGTHTQAKDYNSKLDTRQAGPWEKGTELSIFLLPGVTQEELWYCMHYMKYGAFSALEMSKIQKVDEVLIETSEPNKKRKLK